MSTANIVTLPDRIVGVFSGSGVDHHFWLYWSTTFVDLMLALLSGVLFYNTVKSICATRKATKGCFRQPINVYKLMLLCMSLIVFLRVSVDTFILLMWQEVTDTTMRTLQILNQVADTIAVVPFLTLFYLLLRAGPVVEFQLLRQPIPTDLYPSWKMVRAPVLSLILVVLLSLMVVGTKLLP